MTWRQAREAVREEARRQGLVLSPKELRAATRHMMDHYLHHQRQEREENLQAPDFSPEGVERMLGT